MNNLSITLLDILFLLIGSGCGIVYLSLSSQQTLDGTPGEALEQAILGEFTFGLLGVFAFFKYREH